MKKILSSFIVISLLASQAVDAKNSDLVKVEYIKVKSDKKNLPLAVAFIRVGYRIYRVLSFVHNINELIEDVKKYVDEYGLNRTQIAQHFEGKMKIVLIDSFYSTKKIYKPFENISFKAQLKQKAYTYLINISNSESCLLFPNKLSKNNFYQANREYSLPNKKYKIYSNSSEKISFFLVSSTQPIDIKLKSYFKQTKTVYSCAKPKEVAELLNSLKQKSYIEVKKVDILVK